MAEPKHIGMQLHRGLPQDAEEQLHRGSPQDANEQLGVALTRRSALMGASALAFFGAAAQAQSGPVRIGVLTDESGPYADSAGAGSVEAARMAAEDHGMKAAGRAVEILHADTLNKPDVAGNLARRWYELDGVGAIVDLPVTPVAFAVQSLASQMNRTVMVTAAAASEFTTKTPSPVSSHWADDTHALAAGTAEAIAARGPAKWFFITVDISFGAALQRDATEVIERAGGKVLGSVKHPTNNADFSSHLLQAQSSGADYIGLCSVGGDFVTLMKQAREFGVGRDGKQQLVGFLVYIQDVHALGLDIAQNLIVSEGFYWDQNDSARAFAKRFFEKRKMMPSKDHALIYTAVRHYLKAVDAAGGDEAKAVNEKMRATPFDFFGKPARMREDGRVLFDMGLYRVKKPGESKAPWDYYAPLASVPADKAFLPLAK